MVSVSSFAFAAETPKERAALLRSVLRSRVSSWRIVSSIWRSSSNVARRCSSVTSSFCGLIIWRSSSRRTMASCSALWVWSSFSLKRDVSTEARISRRSFARWRRCSCIRAKRLVICAYRSGSFSRSSSMFARISAAVGIRGGPLRRKGFWGRSSALTGFSSSVAAARAVASASWRSRSLMRARSRLRSAAWSCCALLRSWRRSVGFSDFATGSAGAFASSGGMKWPTAAPTRRAVMAMMMVVCCAFMRFAFSSCVFSVAGGSSDYYTKTTARASCARLRR